MNWTKCSIRFVLLQYSREISFFKFLLFDMTNQICSSLLKSTILIQSLCLLIHSHYCSVLAFQQSTSYPWHIGNGIRKLSCTNGAGIESKMRGFAISRSRRSLSLKATTSNPESQTSSILPIHRVNINSMTDSEFQRKYDRDDSSPVLLNGVFNLDREGWCSQLIESIGDSKLEYQLRDSNGNTELLQGPIDAFIENVYSSSHNRSWFEDSWPSD